MMNIVNVLECVRASSVLLALRLAQHGADNAKVCGLKGWDTSGLSKASLQPCLMA